MFLNSIDKKPIIQRPDGLLIRDLTQSMFDMQSNSFVNLSLFRIPKEYAMRPDLISQASYNNTLYAEYILKYNGISNPFSIGPGDIMIIPDLDNVKEITKDRDANGEDVNAKRIRNSYKYIDPTKVPKRDADLESFDRRNLNGKDAQIQDGALPPNIAADGEKGITYRNGRVYFGENISPSACLRSGMSQSEFLTKVIKSK